MILAVFAFHRQIDVLIYMNRRRVALRLLDSRLRRHPDDVHARVLRARLYYRNGALGRAACDYHHAAPMASTRCQAVIYTELAQVYFTAGKYAQSLAALEAGYALRPHAHAIQAWLAIAHYALRDFDEARIWWQSARRKHAGYARLDGTNWVRPQSGWLAPPPGEAQKISALLNAHPGT